MGVGKEETQIIVVDLQGAPIREWRICIAGETVTFHIFVRRGFLGGLSHPHFVPVQLEAGCRFDDQFQPLVGAKILPIQGQGEYVAFLTLEDAGTYDLAFRLKDDPTVISEPVKVNFKTLYIARAHQGPKVAFGAGLVKGDLVVHVYNRARRAPATLLELQGVHSEPKGISMVAAPPPPPTNEEGATAIQLRVDEPPKESTTYKIWVKGVSIAMDEQWEITVHPVEEIAQLTANPSEAEWFTRKKVTVDPAVVPAVQSKRRWGVSALVAVGSAATVVGVIIGYNLITRTGQWAYTLKEEYTQQTARPTDERLTAFAPAVASTTQTDASIENAEVHVEEAVSLAAGAVEVVGAGEATEAVAGTLVATGADAREDEESLPTATVATSPPQAEAPSTLEERVFDLQGDWHSFMLAWADDIRLELAAQRSAWAAKMHELLLVAEELEGERDRLLQLEAHLERRASELDILYAAGVAPIVPVASLPQREVVSASPATATAQTVSSDPFYGIKEFEALSAAERREAQRIYAEFRR